MQADGQLNDYRGHLVKALRSQWSRRRAEDPTSVQVFVNHLCIGTMDCDAERVQFISSRMEGPIQAVELRSETGTIVGSFVADESGTTRIQFPGRRYRLEAVIENEDDRSMLKLHYHRSGRFTGAMDSLVALLKGSAPKKPAPTALDVGSVLSRPVVAAVQITIATVLLFLVNDRFSREPMSLIGLQDMGATVAANKQMLDRFYESQAVTLRLMEENAGAIRRANEGLAALDRSHQRLTTTLAIMDEKIEKQGDVGKLVRTTLRKLEIERMQMQKQLRELTHANLTLDNAVQKLEKRELAQGLKNQVTDLAKILTPETSEQSPLPKLDQRVTREP